MKQNSNNNFQQGLNALKQGKFNSAENYFRSLLEIEPSNPEINHNLGITLYKLNRFDEAEKLYKKAIKLKPDYVSAFYNLGCLLNDAGRYDEAEKFYKTTITLNQKFTMAHNNLGNTLKALGRFDEAELSYRKAIELKNDYAEAYANIGGLFTDIGKLEEAESSYKKAIELKPSLTEINNSLDIVLRFKKLSSIIFSKKENHIKTKTITNEGLLNNPFISKRDVEPELINTLYKIDLKDLDQTKNGDARYGKGKCSDFKLFQNNFTLIKKVERDLTNIMSKAVKSEIYIMDSFFNILRTKSGTTPHKHIHNFDVRKGLVNKKFSLTYYLSVGDQNCNEPGNLKVYDPEEEIKVYKGKIVIIPANRVHSSAYDGKTDRIMIGVNFYSLA